MNEFTASRDRPMAPPQLFVLVSTRQNIANLPPLLELANPHDQVVWIESREARAGHWSAHARDVLYDLGLVQDCTVEVDHVNDPSQVVAACRAVLKRYGDGTHPVFLIANGGNKMTPLGMLLALRDLRPTVLYGDDKPAVLWKFEGTFDRPPEIRPYLRHQVDVDHILQLSGHSITNHGKALKFWPGPLPAELDGEDYGCDPVCTRELHAAHHLWWAEPDDPGDPVHFKDLPRILEAKRIETWKETVRETIAHSAPESDGVLEKLYHSTRKLADEALIARNREEAGAKKPRASLGNSLERAVAIRTHDWLDRVNPAAVQSAWFNVETEGAQFDVLLVLRNAILLHIECKTLATSQKDLDARLFNLQRASSQLARMVVCVPILTDHTAEPWFAAFHQLRSKLIKGRQPPCLPFTLERQPSSYLWPSGASAPETCNCPSFEDGLADLLHDYEP